jgi:hypothetical protein
MKLKIAVAFAVLLSATLARADSTPITVDVTVAACPQCGAFPGPPINLQAQFTVELVNGIFFNSGEDSLMPASAEYEVMGMTGTLNGSPMTLAAPPEGIGSWLSEGLNGNFELGSVYFTSAAGNSLLEVSDFNLLVTDLNGVASTEAITWKAVDPAPAAMPEPSTWLLLVAGVGFVLMRAVKTRKQLPG